MGSSFKILSVRGIDIRLHITFPLILLWAAFQFGLGSGDVGGAIFGIIAISLLFVLVTLHELGHSFAAQYFGVPVKQIILSPLGGLAQLNRMPEKPIQELVIAIAGPAVNFVIAILMGSFLLLSGFELNNPLQILAGSASLSIMGIFTYVFFYNIMLAVFNLIPGFPLDGGRIFRALLAMKLDYVRATRIAANVGKVVAVGMGIYGLINGGIFLILIAVFIYSAGSQEFQMVRARSVLRGLKVGDVYSDSIYELTPMSTIQQASNLMVYGGQRNFPVLEGERLVGFLTYHDLVRARRTAASHSLITNIMRQDIKPVSYDDDLYEAQEQMQAQRLDTLPVVNGSRFMGVINLRQIVEQFQIMGLGRNVIPQSQSA